MDDDGITGVLWFDQQGNRHLYGLPFAADSSWHAMEIWRSQCPNHAEARWVFVEVDKVLLHYQPVDQIGITIPEKA